MDPAIAVLLAVVTTFIGVGTPIAVKEFRDIRNKCEKTNERQTVVETKLDMLLEHAGFDVRKANRKIKENIEELKQNDKPSVGCIDINELYKGGA